MCLLPDPSPLNTSLPSLPTPSLQFSSPGALPAGEEGRHRGRAGAERLLAACHCIEVGKRAEGQGQGWGLGSTRLGQ